MNTDGIPSDTHLRGRWVLAARVAWIAIVGLAVGLYILSIPSQFAHSQILCDGSACPYDQISQNNVQELQRAGLSLPLSGAAYVAINVICALIFLIVAAVIFGRRSDEGIGLFASFALATFGIAFNAPLETLSLFYPTLLLPAQLVDVVGGASIAIFFLVFPNGRFVPRWMLVLLPFHLLRSALHIFAPELLGQDYGMLLTVALVLYAQVYRYVRVSNAIERQQTKWAVAGMAVGLVGFGGLITWGAVFSTGGPTGLSYLIQDAVLHLFLLLIPLSVGMAILRSHLWDIDIFIRRTLIYGVLTGLLALVYLGAVVALQAVFTALTGQQRSELVTVLSTLVIASLVVPLRNRVQATIDRRFYRRKYDTAQTLATFAATVRDEVDLNELSKRLVAVVDETMQPIAVSLWLKGPE